MAGAWTLPAGEGLVISTLSASSADVRFSEMRERVEAPLFRKAEIQVLAEYGITDRFTLRGKGSVERWRQEGGEPPGYQGFGVQEVGGRFRFLQRGAFVGSAEASLRVGEAHDGAKGVELEYEVRLLGGYGFAIRGRPAFVDVQAGGRLRPQAVSDEILFDLTVGVRPIERVLLLAQSFSTVAAALSENGAPLYDRHKLQASAVVDLTPTLSVQAGANRTLAGSQALEETGVFGALWLRF